MGKVSAEPFYQYAEGVQSGKVVAGKFIRQAVDRFYRDMDRKDFIFDYREGLRIVNFARLCHHWKGPKKGTPIELDPHQIFYLVQKYGWKNAATGLPRFRRSFKEISRKTGKTTEAAIEALFHMAKGLEESAQVWCGANKEADAILVVNDAGRIAESSPALKGSFQVQIHEPYCRRVIFKKRGAFMAFMTKTPQDGADVSMGIGDECHDWPSSNVRDRIEAGMGNRIAPVFTAITTAGFDRYSYCYNTLRSTAVKILDGSVEDDEQLIMMFELDADDDWNDELNWEKSNPNIKYSPTQLPYLLNQYKKAKNEGGATEVNFKTKNLNQWTDAASVWIQDDLWMSGVHGITELKNLECYGGLYTASTESLNCFILFFPDVRGINVFKLYSWLPEKFVKKNEDNVDYQKWVNDEFIIETPGNSADHRIIAKDVIEICMGFDVRVVGYDRTFGQYVAPDLEAEGIPVMEIYQGYNNLGQQTEQVKKMVMDKTIEHFGNPVLRWQMGNTVLHRNTDGLEKPDKAASGSRIGAVSAMLNAMVARFLMNKEGVMTDFKCESLK
jgi:phage terminase large subunit-like protein